KRSLHLTEGIGDLDQTPELDRSREIARRAHDEGKHYGRLVVAYGEKGEKFLPFHDRPPVIHYRHETGAETAQLVFLAAIQRNAFAVLAETHQIKTEVRLVFLLIEVERNERFADLVGEPGTDDGVDDGHPNHIAIDDVGRAAYRHMQGSGYRT